MAAVEDEKGHTIAEKYLRKKYGDDYTDFLETEGQSYLDGYEQGYENCRYYAHDYYKPKWHDLRKDPNDLPQEYQDVLCFCSTTLLSYYVVGRFVLIDNKICWWTNKNKLYNVIAWCELPKFEGL